MTNKLKSNNLSLSVLMSNKLKSSQLKYILICIILTLFEELYKITGLAVYFANL